MGRIWKRLAAFLTGGRYDADLQAELAFHLDLERAKHEQRGNDLDPPRQAHLAFGSLTGTMEACRDERRLAPFVGLSRDVLAGLRTLRSTPLLTGAAIISLTLGIGATTALFSILNSLSLRPLPVAAPDRLVVLAGGEWTNPIWEQIRARQDTLFDGALAWGSQALDLSESQETDQVSGAYVSGRFFEVLGLHPEAGRLLVESDDRRGGGEGGPVAVISHRLWHTRFAAAPDIVGRRILIEHRPFVIVGVMPRTFLSPEVGQALDVVIPLGTESLVAGRDSRLDGRFTWWLNIVARLRPDQSVAAATSALRTVQSDIRDATLTGSAAGRTPGHYLTEPFTFTAVSASPSRTRSQYEQPLVLLALAVTGILLLACTNIAGLLLARASTRHREFALRLALGASRARLGRQILVEVGMLAAIGAGLGLMFARWSSALLVRQLATWRGAVSLDLHLDWRVLLFTLGLTMLTTVVFGLGPLLLALRTPLSDATRQGVRSTPDHAQALWRQVLVAAQITISVTLLVGAGLFLRTFVSLQSVPLGFAPHNLVVGEVNLRPSRVAAADRLRGIEDFVEALTRQPHIARAAASVIVPLSGAGWNTKIDSTVATGPQAMTWVNAVSPGWFATYGIRLVAGRDFTAGDRNGPDVAIVNRAFLERFQIAGGGLGQQFRALGPPDSVTYEVVGVVEDAVYRSAREGAVSTIYVPLAREDAPAQVAVTVAVKGAQTDAERDVLAAAAQAVPGAAVTFRTFDDLSEALVTRERLIAILSSFLGALGLVLVAVGVGGVTGYTVQRRRTELAVRLALGARPEALVAGVIGRMSLLVVAGLIAGGGLALWLTRYTQSLLFAVEPTDPPLFAFATMVLGGVSLAAAWLPARRAMVIDPGTLLRGDGL